MGRSPPSRAGARSAPAATTRAFLFTDLRDFTPYVERHGDAAAAKLLRSYRDLIRREVARFKGAEIKTEGDSFYVVFDAASAALDCAVALIEKLRAHNAKEPEHRLNVGVGIHAGETIAFDRQFVGSAVIIPSRLASQALAGEVLVSDTLRGLVRTGHKHSMTDRGPLSLKGVSEPIRVWSIRLEPDADPTGVMHHDATATTPDRPAPTSGLFVCPVLVGRVAELARALELLELSGGGHGQAVLVTGEAGVGKTAFVRAIESKAREDGLRVLRGATLESESGVPYAPFVAAIRSGFRGLERARLTRVVLETAPDLAQLFPELRRTAERANGLEQQVVAQAFLQLFATFAREAPILVVLEDLHWADEASLALLHYLARELKDARALLVATYRSDELHRRHPMLRAAANLQRERLAVEIRLKRLTPDEIGELIRETLAVHAQARAIAPGLRDAIYERAEGNPFFTEELLKALVDSGGLVTEGDQWSSPASTTAAQIPATVREAVRSRVDQLSADAQATLSRAAVIGQRFDFELLKAVRGVDDDDLEAHLRDFIEKQLVVEASDADEAYAFRHALTREVVYDDLLVRERKRAHRVVAAALETRKGEPALLAGHLLAAGEQAAAVPPLLTAGRRAFIAEAPREAVSHLERAVGIGVADDALPATLELIAEAYDRFDTPRACKAAHEALTVYRERRDVRGQSRMLRLLSRCQWLLGMPAHLANAAEAVAVLDADGDSVELGRAKANLAHLRLVAMLAGMSSDFTPQLVQEALDIGRQFGDVWTIANALITSRAGKRFALRASDFPSVIEGRDLADRSGFPEVAVRGYINLIGAVGDLDEGWKLFTEATEYARRHGIEQSLLVATGVFVAFGRGDWDTAAELYARVPERNVGPWDHAAAEMTLLRQGPSVAAPLYQALAARHESAGRARIAVVARARALVMQDDIAGARSQLAALGGTADPAPPPPMLLPVALACDAREWLTPVGGVIRQNFAEGSPQRSWFRAIEAIFDGDSDAAGDALDESQRQGASLHWLSPDQTVMFLAREVRRRRLPLRGKWPELIAGSLVSADRVRAPWWRSELERLRSDT